MSTRLLLLALVVALAGCSGPRTSDSGIDPSLWQDVYLPAGDTSAAVERYIVSPYYPDNAVKIRVLPAGSTANPNAMEEGPDGKPVKVREIVLPSAGSGAQKHTTTVPCPICGKPIKVRVRRPSPPKKKSKVKDDGDEDW